jgi:hypothetical protein
MADKPIDDRTINAALEKLKAYNAYKANQLQKAGGGPDPIEQSLQTVEMWAQDPQDTGKAWGQAKQKESNEKLQDAQHWRQKVEADDQQAAQEANLRANLDMKQAKLELKKQLEQYVETIQQQADAGKPGFKAKLAEVKTQSAEAQKFIDQDLEKSMDTIASKNAEMRKKNKLIAQKMDQRATEAKKWNAEFGDDPGKLPAGQRADVQAALDQIAQWCADKAAEVQPFGPSAAPHVDSLKGVQSWASGLKPKIAGAQGPASKAAKDNGKAGVANARQVLAQLEAFQGGIEGDANDQLEIFRQWTDRNNETAKQWINSDNPKLREWAQEWMKTQK